MPKLLDGTVVEVVLLVATMSPGLLLMDRRPFTVDVVMFGDLSERSLMQPLLVIMLLSPGHKLRSRPGRGNLVAAGTGMIRLIGEAI